MTLRNKPELRGLILAGGLSSRMGLDKASLEYHGRPQLLHLYELLGAAELQTHISCRPEQALEENFRDLPCLPDRFIGFGPLGGIMTAMAQVPDCAWMVVACDLPLLTKERIDDLLTERDHLQDATAYFNSENSRFEPLFAIYEPSSYGQMLKQLERRKTCPQKVLFNSAVKQLELPEQSFLFNANTPAERERVSGLLKETVS